MIYGIFNDEDVLMKAIKSLKEKGIKVADVISPYPIHGMDEALNLNRTRISICCFLLRSYRMLSCDFDDVVYEHFRLAHGHWRQAQFCIV